MIPERLNEITDLQARMLCDQLREWIVDSVSRTGGHLASSLGVVEATVAIHRVFDLNTDRLVFDVGHQCYAHKILTQRGGQMDTLRKLGGLSGFPKPREHRADAFIAGHASNAVSVALGMARARTWSGDLTKTDDVYSSPVYYLRQNDIIYIEPTQLKQDTSKAYGSSYMQLGFWVGLLGTITSLITLFTK